MEVLCVLYVHRNALPLLLVLFLGMGTYAVWDQQTWLWKPSTYFADFAHNTVPTKIIIFYALETGYYLFSTVAIFYEPYMKDRYQMFTHHILTSLLLISSFLLYPTRLCSHRQGKEAVRRCNHAAARPG